MGTTGTLVESVRTLDDDAVLDRFRELELEHRRREAELAMLVDEVDRRHLYRADGHRTVRNWMIAEANWSNAQIVRRRRLGRLIDAIAEAGEALAQGHIGIAQADELAAAHANPRCGEQLAECADVLLEQCEQLRFDDARFAIQRWVCFADLDGAHREQASSQERRSAHVSPHDGGLFVNATGGSPIDAAEMTAIFDAFVEREFRNDVAERTSRYGENAPTALLARSDAQRRFDALHTIFRSAAANPTLAPRAPIVVNLIVDEWTFRDVLARHGLANDAPDWCPPPDPSRRRCETDDGTPVLPDDVLRAALDGHIRRIVMNSDHVVIDAGRKRRLFEGAMRDIARVLARRCECPGCTVKSRFAQVDHLAEWTDDRGDTALVNADASCGRHNRLKHRTGMVGYRRPDGQINWYRRDGTEITAVGRRHLVDFHDEQQAIRARVDALGP